MAHTHVRITAQTVDRGDERVVLWAIEDPDPRGGVLDMGVVTCRTDSCAGCGRELDLDDLVVGDEAGLWCAGGERPCR